MPDRPPAGSRRLIALIMLASAVSLAAVAFLIYTGAVPMPGDIRFIAALAVGGAAAADFLVGLWFFRIGQSS
jgi:hypothetical protein